MRIATLTLAIFLLVACNSTETQDNDQAANTGDSAQTSKQDTASMDEESTASANQKDADTATGIDAGAGGAVYVIKIDGMYCGQCSAGMTSALEEELAVKRVFTDLQRGEAIIEMQEDAALLTLESAKVIAAGEGYEAVSVTPVVDKSWDDVRAGYGQ